MAIVQGVTKPLQEILGGIDLPDGTLDFLARTLHLDPKNRSSAAECLAHPFLRALRDADARKQDRQREERRRKGAHCTNDDDGIEEDIPGDKSSCASPLPPSKAQSKGGEVSSSSPKASAKYSPSMKNVQAELIAASPKKKQHHHHHHHVGEDNSSDNNTECDSDDIQELIEGDEGAGSTFSPRGGEGKHRDEGARRPPKATRRRSISGAKGRRDGDPVDRDSCYEDDFED
jgi:serine/threonine protein kinase